MLRQKIFRETISIPMYSDLIDQQSFVISTIRNVLLSKLALGTAQFGLDYGLNNTSGRLSKSKLKYIKLRPNFGIDTLDTAVAYEIKE